MRKTKTQQRAKRIDWTKRKAPPVGSKNRAKYERSAVFKRRSAAAAEGVVTKQVKTKAKALREKLPKKRPTKRPVDAKPIKGGKRTVKTIYEKVQKKKQRKERKRRKEEGREPPLKERPTGAIDWKQPGAPSLKWVEDNAPEYIRKDGTPAKYPSTARLLREPERTQLFNALRKARRSGRLENYIDAFMQTQSRMGGEYSGFTRQELYTLLFSP